MQSIKVRMHIYLTTRHGVSIKDVVGAFLNPNTALSYAVKCMKKEYDNWHRYEVQELEVDKETDIEFEWMYDTFEPLIVYKINRSKNGDVKIQT